MLLCSRATPSKTTVALGRLLVELRYRAPWLLPHRPKVNVETDLLARVPTLLPETGSSAETLVLALAEQNEVAVVSYGTEAGIFQATGGVPTVVCGPGSILQAHKPDEYIARSELVACDDFLGRLLTAMSR